jgi:hypothetical protein
MYVLHWSFDISKKLGLIKSENENLFKIMLWKNVISSHTIEMTQMQSLCNPLAETFEKRSKGH